MPVKHLKRLFAPKDWMLSKLTGVFAPKPTAGPHKLRECLPLQVILRNRLKYALNAREVRMILRQGLVNVDGRKRADPKFPAGFMDVITIPKTGESFRIMYDSKGRFELVKVGEAEASTKLCRVNNVFTTSGRIPMITTHDGRRIRFPDPKIARGDTVAINTQTGKITEIFKARAGKVAMITGGANRGLVGEIVSIERHPGSFDIARLKDQAGNELATRNDNVFVLAGSFDKISISMPKNQGHKLNIIEEREKRLIAAETAKTKKVKKTRK